MRRFVELGMPFPLFEADITHAALDEAGICTACGATAEVRFRETCYACFRAGRSDNVISTELGMVRSQDAERGLTHGRPLDGPQDLPGYELVAHPIDPDFPDEHWYSVKLAVGDLRELVRTPNFHTWQDANWLFCCQRPCVYLGNVDLAELRRQLGDDPDDVMQRVLLVQWLAEMMSESIGAMSKLLSRIDEGRVATYAFRCQTCSKLRGYWDQD